MLYGKPTPKLTGIGLGMKAAQNQPLKYHFPTPALEVKISKRKVGAHSQITASWENIDFFFSFLVTLL